MTTKQLANRLIKLCPNNRIVVRQTIRKYTTSDIQFSYDLYIDNNEWYKHNWSSEFDTIKELINDINVHLAKDNKPLIEVKSK